MQAANLHNMVLLGDLKRQDNNTSNDNNKDYDDKSYDDKDLDDSVDGNKQIDCALFYNPSDLTDLTSDQSYGYIPANSNASNQPCTSAPTPSVFNKLSEEQRQRNFNEAIQKINKGNKFVCYTHRDYNYFPGKQLDQYVICSRKFLNFNSRINYSVKYMKDIAYSCNFNLKYFDSELLELLLPVIHPDSEFRFENINYSTAENIAELENLFSDYSIDLYAEIDKGKPILLYPIEETCDYKYKFSDVSLLFTIIKVMSNIFIKDKLFIFICKSILNDSDFISLLKHRWCLTISIKNCLIKCTTECINLSQIIQPCFLFNTKIEASDDLINGK